MQALCAVRVPRQSCCCRLLLCAVTAQPTHCSCDAGPTSYQSAMSYPWSLGITTQLTGPEACCLSQWLVLRMCQRWIGSMAVTLTSGEKPWQSRSFCPMLAFGTLLLLNLPEFGHYSGKIVPAIFDCCACSARDSLLCLNHSSSSSSNSNRSSHVLVTAG